MSKAALIARIVEAARVKCMYSDAQLSRYAVYLQGLKPNLLAHQAKLYHVTGNAGAGK